MKNLIEKFKDVPGYEGKYQVSNLGNVRSFVGKGRLLKPVNHSKGYLYVNLYKNGNSELRTIHRLVAEAFLSYECNKKTGVVDHINNDRKDNRLENLRIISNGDNVVRGRKKMTSKYKGVYWDKRNNKWRSQISHKGELIYIGLFNSEKEAHLAYQNRKDQLKELNK